MLVDTENTSDQFISRLAVYINIHGDLYGWISNFCHIYGYGGYPSHTRKTAYGIQPYGTNVI